MAERTFRLRVRFGKTGRLRHLSHLEVMRACERSVRRAGLSYAVTQGFNPKMKVGFGPALPVGTAGLHEYVDVWLTEYVSAGDVLKRLTEATPPDLAPTGAEYVPDRSPSLSAALTIARYEADVIGEGLDRQALDEAVKAVVGARELAVPHKGKMKVFELDRSLPEEPEVVSAPPAVRVVMTVRIGPEGSLRPEMLVHAALERAGTTSAVVRVTRTDLLQDVEGEWRTPM